MAFLFTDEEKAQISNQESPSAIQQDRPAFTHRIKIGEYDDTKDGASGETANATRFSVQLFEVPNRMLLRRLLFTASGAGGGGNVAAALYKVLNWSTATNVRHDSAIDTLKADDALLPALQLRFIATFGAHHIVGNDKTVLRDLPQDIDITDTGGPYAIVFNADSTNITWNDNHFGTRMAQHSFRVIEAPADIGTFPEKLTANLTAFGDQGPYMLLRSKLGIRLYPTSFEILGI